MTFEVTQATTSDAASLCEVFFAAFSDTFNRTLFPPTPEVRAWLIEHLLCGKGQKKNEIILKITDPARPDMPVAFAKWICPADAADCDVLEAEVEAGPAWPASSDPELCERFFGTIDEHHRRFMCDRPHYCMFNPLISHLEW